MRTCKHKPFIRHLLLKLCTYRCRQVTQITDVLVLWYTIQSPACFIFTVKLFSCLTTPDYYYWSITFLYTQVFFHEIVTDVWIFSFHFFISAIKTSQGFLYLIRSMAMKSSRRPWQMFSQFLMRKVTMNGKSIWTNLVLSAMNSNCKRSGFEKLCQLFMVAGNNFKVQNAFLNVLSLETSSEVIALFTGCVIFSTTPTNNQDHHIQ